MITSGGLECDCDSTPYGETGLWIRAKAECVVNSGGELDKMRLMNGGADTHTNGASDVGYSVHYRLIAICAWYRGSRVESTWGQAADWRSVGARRRSGVVLPGYRSRLWVVGG